MSDAEIIKDSPLCVNISRLKNYLLAPDEAIMFDWLVIKQSAVFGYKWFFYSQERIRQETRIKRSSLERIIKRFHAMGILSFETRQKPNEVGRTRFFRMNFDKCSQKLSEIIDTSNSDVTKVFKRYFDALARAQAKIDKGLQPKETYQDRNNREKVDSLYKALCSVYKCRIEMYNRGELTDSEPQQKKDYTALVMNGKIKSSLLMLAGRYDVETCKNAFTAFCDDVLVYKDKYKNNPDILAYFLTYDKVYDSFKIVDMCIAYFQKNYSHR